MDNFTADLRRGVDRIGALDFQSSKGRETVYGVPTVTGDSRLQSDVLEDLSDAHQYRRWLADLGRPHLGDDPIEIGSGTGDYALEWLPGRKRFTATEADQSRYELLAERFAEHGTIEVRRLLLPADHSASHTAAVAFNVLEHIPDHVGALRGMAALVQPGGTIVILVPAFPSAMSRFDRAVGHERRYTKASLGAALTEAGLQIEELRYVNPVGLLVWYVTVKALRMTPRNGLMLRLYDRCVVPLARFADRRVSSPFGKSVFAVARVD
jgi:SAM-dependent methyltransferase